MADPVHARATAAMRRRLVTPEGVDLGLVLASGGQRVSAFVIDMLLLFGTMFLFTLALALIGAASGPAGGTVLTILWLLGFFLLRNFYFILFEMGPRAATLGKRWTGLRVVARNGGRLTADAVIARNLMREIEVYLPLSFLAQRAVEGSAGGTMATIGFGWALIFLLFPLFNRDRLRVGDILAGTWVVSAPKSRLGDDLVHQRWRGEGPRHAFSEEQLDAYGIYELQTLEQVLRQEDPETLAAVSWSIRNKIGYGEIESSEAFLAAYYEALRRRLERKLLFGRRRADKHDR